MEMSNQSVIVRCPTCDTDDKRLIVHDLKGSSYSCKRCGDEWYEEKGHSKVEHAMMYKLLDKANMPDLHWILGMIQSQLHDECKEEDCKTKGIH